jgi:hypothetical protein
MKTGQYDYCSSFTWQQIFTLTQKYFKIFVEMISGPNPVARYIGVMANIRAT